MSPRVFLHPTTARYHAGTPEELRVAGPFRRSFAALLAGAFLMATNPSPAQPKKGATLLLTRGNAEAGKSAPAPPPTEVAPIQIRVGPYFGWERSFTISNGKVEAVVVPAIGRVMQFRFVGQASPLWEDPSLRGRAPDPE